MMWKKKKKRIFYQTSLSQKHKQEIRIQQQPISIQACILGAFIGDAVGAYLEFKNQVFPEEIEKALTLEGGGSHNIGAAQVTDDSEMAMCLFQGLLSGKGKLDLDEIAKMYRKWYFSNPFDIGMTTHSALSALDNKASSIYKSVKENNTQSQSNGCLMRITPFAVWCSQLSNEDLYKAVHLETHLTHCNKTAIDAVYLYCLTIRLILNGETDRVKIYDTIKLEANLIDSKDINGWIDELEQGNLPDATYHIAWLKIGFISMLHYLKNSEIYDYETALRDIVSWGGDTDTNAAIVCGVMGAFLRRDQLNQDHVNKLLSFRCGSEEDQKKFKGIVRPLFLIPGLVLTEDEFEEFFEIIPKKLEVIYEGNLLNDVELNELLSYLKPFVQVT
eukprot:403353304